VLAAIERVERAYNKLRRLPTLGRRQQPGTHHGGWVPEFDRDYLERVTGWFDRYLK
jgi:hypothetical protein